jgi:hypothetical protein
MGTRMCGLPGQPRWYHEHTFQQDCKWGRELVPHERRKSGQPREPKPKAHAEPTAGIPAIVDGQELARAAEEEVAEQDRQTVRQSRPTVPAATASSSSIPLASSSSSTLPPTVGRSRSTEPVQEDEARRARGPDLVPRHRRSWREQGDNPERPHDWTQFDIGRVIRIFRTHREGAIRPLYENFMSGGGTHRNMS